jgi:hypothetical protein
VGAYWKKSRSNNGSRFSANLDCSQQSTEEFQHGRSVAMTDFEKISATKKAAQSRLIGLLGVHTVRIGSKPVGGWHNTEAAIFGFKGIALARRRCRFAALQTEANG